MRLALAVEFAPLRAGLCGGNSRAGADGRHPCAKRVCAPGSFRPRRRTFAGAHGRLTDQRGDLRADAAMRGHAVKSRRPVLTFRVSGHGAPCGRFLPHSAGAHASAALYSSQNAACRQAKAWKNGDHLPQAHHMLMLERPYPEIAAEMRRLRALQADHDPRAEELAAQLVKWAMDRAHG